MALIASCVKVRSAVAPSGSQPPAEARSWLARRPALWIAALAIAEVFLVARANRDTYDTAKLFVPAVAKSLGLARGEYRIMNPINPNTAMLSGEYDIWGEDPGVTRRYEIGRA